MERSWIQVPPAALLIYVMIMQVFDILGNIVIPELPTKFRSKVSSLRELIITTEGDVSVSLEIFASSYGRKAAGIRYYATPLAEHKPILSKKLFHTELTHKGEDFNLFYVTEEDLYNILERRAIHELDKVKDLLGDRGVVILTPYSYWSQMKNMPTPHPTLSVSYQYR